MFFAVWMAANPATPAPSTKTRAGASLPARNALGIETKTTLMDVRWRRVILDAEICPRPSCCRPSSGRTRAPPR